MQIRGRLQIIAARHQRDALQRIIMRNAEMIGCRYILPPQDHIAENFRAASMTHPPPASPILSAAP
jgi:hypothetical protein